MKNIRILFSDLGLKIHSEGLELSEKQINTSVPEYFYGEECFITSYLSLNGVYFIDGACFYRDTFYKVSSGDYNRMGVEGFYFIPQYFDQKQPDSNLSILRVQKIRSMYSDSVSEFTKTHYPFASDAGGNEYWIDTDTGCIKYIRWGIK